jgi:hypothetical protein
MYHNTLYLNYKSKNQMYKKSVYIIIKISIQYTPI